MAIRKFDPKTMVIEVGQWVCPHSIILDVGCAKPRKVVKVAGQRVYWEMYRKNDDIDAGYHANTSIVYVADTEEESNQVADLEWSRRMAVEAAKAAVHAEYDAKVAALLDKDN